MVGASGGPSETEGLALVSVRAKAFTLVELLIVLAIVALLVAMLVPSFASARRQAGRIQCAARLHSVHTALWTYAADARRRLPPFAFEDFRGNLPASGHWGGTADGTGVGFGRRGVERVNLAVLTGQERLALTDVRCPAADTSSADAPFSSYCLRFPPSEDLFSTAPGLAYRGGELLGVYRMAAGGVDIRVGTGYQAVPQVRLGAVYRSANEVELPPGCWNPMADALLADGFWDDRAVGHGPWRNVCFGGGSVRAVRSGQAASFEGEDSPHHAKAAEVVWRAMDQQR